MRLSERANETRTEDVAQLAFLSSITHSLHHSLSNIHNSTHTFPYPYSYNQNSQPGTSSTNRPSGILTILFYSILFYSIQFKNYSFLFETSTHPRLTTSLRNIATKLGPSHLLHAMHATASLNRPPPPRSSKLYRQVHHPAFVPDSFLSRSFSLIRHPIWSLRQSIPSCPSEPRP